MEIKEILSRIGYVRNKANLSAREVSLRMGMSPQYVAQLESGRIVLTVEKLLQILEICEFPIERFFSSNIADYQIDNELKSLINSLPADKKKNIIEFIKKWELDIFSLVLFHLQVFLKIPYFQIYIINMSWW